MNVLVVGSDRVDAGKTTFATGLIARTNAIGFKPRAANDYWFDHDDYRSAVEAGRLYGKDAYRLAATNRGEHTPEEINPIHRLWRPAPTSGTGILGREDRVFVCDRVGDEYVVNATVSIPPLARERLPLDEAMLVDSLTEFNAVMERRYLPVLGDLATRIANTDVAIIESYGDIARPLQDFRPDVVAVVEPARLSVYDGGRYHQSCEAVSRTSETGYREERVETVIASLDPETRVPLSALPDPTHAAPATIADTYEAAYNALFAAV